MQFEFFMIPVADCIYSTITVFNTRSALPLRSSKNFHALGFANSLVEELAYDSEKVSTTLSVFHLFIPFSKASAFFYLSCFKWITLNFSSFRIPITVRYGEMTNFLITSTNITLPSIFFLAHSLFCHLGGEKRYY